MFSALCRAHNRVLSGSLNAIVGEQCEQDEGEHSNLEVCGVTLLSEEVQHLVSDCGAKGQSAELKSTNNIQIFVP